MSNFLIPSVLVFSYLIFNYLIWKSLREDYLEGQIFGFTFFVGIFTVLGFLITHRFLPDFWFWGTFLFFVSGVYYAFKRYGIKPLEVTDSLIFSTLLTMELVLFTSWIKNYSNWQQIYLSFICLILICIYSFLKSNYRKFTWYKSGKMGFAGIFVAGLFFLTRALIALLFQDMISLAGRIDLMISFLLSLTFFGLVFKLAKI